MFATFFTTTNTSSMMEYTVIKIKKSMWTLSEVLLEYTVNCKVTAGIKVILKL